MPLIFRIVSPIPNLTFPIQKLEPMRSPPLVSRIHNNTRIFYCNFHKKLAKKGGLARIVSRFLAENKYLSPTITNFYTKINPLFKNFCIDITKQFLYYKRDSR